MPRRPSAPLGPFDAPAPMPTAEETQRQQQQQQQCQGLSRRYSSRTASLGSFTTLDDALRSLSMSPTAPLALDTARASLEQATPVPAAPADPVVQVPHYFDSYGYKGSYRPAPPPPPQQQQQQQRLRRPSLICPHARLDEQQLLQGELGQVDEGERAVDLGLQRALPSRPQQHQHQLTAPALLQTQRLPKSKGGELDCDGLADVETCEEEEAEAQDTVASPQPTSEGVGVLCRTASGEDGAGEQQLDYCNVVASSNHGRPSYATLTFSSFSSSSSGSSSSATDSSSGSSSTVTAATGFSTTPGVGRRASAPATPTLSSSSSWSSFCPGLARVPSYDEESSPAPESPGAVPTTPAPMHLPLPGSGGGVGSRRPYTPSPLTPFPHHSQYFGPSLPPSKSSSSSYMRSPSPYAHVTRRASAMAAPHSPVSSSRDRDYMNPDTPPRTPPAAAAIMMAALKRRRSENAAVMTRKGLGSGSCSPLGGSRTLAVSCASCGRCKPEKSRFCCGWPPVHMVLFHGPSGKGWATDEKKGRAARRSRAVTGGRKL